MHSRFRIQRLIQIGRLVHVWILVAAAIINLWPAEWPFPWT